jgi:hypothetical protein
MRGETATSKLDIREQQNYGRIVANTVTNIKQEDNKNNIRLKNQ